MPDQENYINRPGVALGLPKTPIVPELAPYTGGGGDALAGKNVSVNDLFLSGLSKIKPVGKADIPMSSVYTGTRYKETRPGTDYEEMAANQQSSFEKWRNSIGKMVGVAGTSFTSGTVGLLYGLGAMVKDQRLASLIDNDVTRGADDIMKKFEDYAPNYYTHAEQDAEWYSPKNILTSNFWSDKVLKNLGYSVGAIGGGIAWSKLIGKIGLTNALVKAGQGMEAATAVENAMATVPKLQKYAAFENALNSVGQKYIKTPLSAVLKDSDRILTSTMGTFGEASMEGLQNMNDFRQKAIQEYIDKNGITPTGKDLDEINMYADKVGMYTWGMNSLLLTGTNYIQLPKILGSSRKADKALINEIDQATLGGQYSKMVPATKFGTILEKTKGISNLLFAPSEAFEEGAQFAIQTGVNDYFKRAKNNREDVSSFLGNLHGAMGNVFGEGVDQALSSKEGLESILIGGISGGIQQFRGTLRENKEKRTNTEVALSAINKTNIKKALQDGAGYLGIGIGSQKLRQEAIRNNDKLSEKDYEQDFVLSYLMPRVKYGKKDSVIEELSYYESQAMNNEGFDQLVTSGIANQKETKEQFLARIANLKKTANSVDQLYSAINDKYENKANEKGEKIYSDEIVDKMVYAASKIADYDVRIPQLNSSLSEAGIVTQDILQSIIKDNKPNREATAKALNDINDLNVISGVKDDLKLNLSHIMELSLRRKLFIEEYDDIKSNPTRYQTAPEFAFGETEEVPVTVAQKDETKPEKRLEIGKEYSLAEPLTKDGSQLNLAPKITALSQTLGGEIEVKLPNGKTSFITPEEFKKYNISDENNTSQEMADILDKAIDTVLNDDKYADVKKQVAEISKDLGDKKLDKVGFVNSLDNQSLIDAIENEFDKQTKVIIETKQRLKRETEQLAKNKEEIAKQQGEIIHDSGDVGTNNPNADKDIPEGKIPPANILFISGTSESEKEGYYVDANGDPIEAVQAPIHVKNSREFLNNVGGMKNRKNMRAILVTPALAKAYGLEGLVQMSYGKPLDSNVDEIANVNDVDNGFIAQVFVEQVGDKLFFVDKEGNQIGEVGKQVENVENVIFQTMRTTALTYNNGVPRYRKNQKEEAEAYAAAWKKQRATIFATDPSVSPTIYGFQVSRGIAQKGEENNHISGTLISKEDEERILATDQTLIQIPTAGVVAHHTGQINMPNGRPVLVHNDNVEFLNNVQLKGKRALAIYEAINQIATEINDRVKAGKKIIINKKLARFLQNVLYWRLGSTTEGSNQINISEDGTSISFAGKTYSIPEIASKKDEIIEAIEKSYHNVNNKTLSAEMFEKPFEEYYIDENGKLSDQPRVWTNYQTYLLSSKNPDGSSRAVSDTPLFTKILAPIAGVTNTHQQKYATLVGLDLPVGVIAKPATPTATPTAPKAPTQRKYDYDGTTDNIFTTPFGDVIFTVKEGEEPKVDVNDETFLATRNKIIKKLNDVRIKKGEPTLSEEELIPEANAVVFTLIKKELETDMVAAPEAPVVTPAPAAPISELERLNNEVMRLANIRSNDKVVRQAIIDSNKGKITIEELDAVFKKWDDENGMTEAVAAYDAEKKKQAAPVSDKKADIEKQALYFNDKWYKEEFNDGANVSTYIDSSSGTKTIFYTLPNNKGIIAFTEVEKNTNRFSITANAKDAKSNNIKDAFQRIQKYLPLEHELIENKSISVDGLRVWNNFIKNGKYVETNEVKEIPISAIDKSDLFKGLNYTTENDWSGSKFEDKQETKDEAIARVQKYLKDNNLNFKVRIDDNIIKVEVPVLKSNAELAAIEGKQSTPSVDKSVAQPIINPKIVITGTRAGMENLSSNNWNEKADGEITDVRGRYDKFEKDGFVEDTDKKGNKIINYMVRAQDYVGRPGFLQISLIVPKDTVVDKTLLKNLFDIQVAMLANKYKLNKDYINLTNTTNDDFNKMKNAIVYGLENIQGKAAEAPKEPGSFNPNNVGKRDDMGFRKVGKLDKTDRMSDADLKAFKEWHDKYVPFIPFEVLENMVNINSTEKAWGVFENGVAKFVKGGLRGTEYHEIGEAIWNGMLTEDERQALIAEFRAKAGKFTDRETNRKYNYDDASVSDDMVKERILDDFADFRVGKLPARTLGEKILNFFRRILGFVKSFVAKPSLKEQLFKAIETGKFKDRVLSVESKSMPPQYRAAGHLTEEQTNAYVKDMTAISASIILGNGKIGTIDKSAIYDLRKLTSDDIFNKIEEFYTKQGVKQELGNKTWEDLVEKTKQQLRTLLKVDFNEEDLININEGETNKNDYAKEPFSTDWKKNAPMGIKFVSATLLETEPTNQENSNSFELPKAKVNKKYQTYSLVPYTRVFATILDTLKNTTSIGRAISKLVGLANEDSNYVRMFKALGGSYSTNAEGKMEKTINFQNFKMEDWRLFIEMMQTYTKQKPNAVVQYISQGQVYSGSALVTGAVNQTTKEWIQNMRTLSQEPESLVKYDKIDKTYSVEDLSKIPTATPEEKEEFLKKLGIIFPIEAWRKLKEEKQKEFTLAVASLKEYLQEAKEIMNIQKRTLDVAGQYDTLAELLVSVTHPNQENTRINLDGKQSNSFADNNTPSVFENEFNEAATLDELLKARPELNDIYSKGSQLLKKGGRFFDKNGKRTSLQLKLGYIEGTKNVDDNKGTTSVKLTLGARFTQELNQNLLGNYYILIPADGSTEWMMNLGNTIAFEDVENGKSGWKQINDVFRGYLTDDVALALDADNRKQLRNVGNLDKIAEIESRLVTLKAITNKSDDQKKEIKDLNAQLEYFKKKPYELRFFKDILSEKTLSKINEMIAEDKSQSEIEKYIDDNIDSINESIKEYIESTVSETKDILMKNGQMRFVKEDEYSYPTLDDNFTKRTDVGLNKNKLSEEDVTNLLTFANANYIINNIEFHKTIFGDPYQFAIKDNGSLDETKRIKSFLSPRRTTFDSPQLNTFLNEEFNKAGDIQLQPGEPGYHQNKSYINTVTANDVTVMGSVTNMKNVSKEVKKAFAKTNEADAASFIMDGTYRELKMKNGQWSPEAEAWHQWQMAYTRQNLPGFKYSEDARGKALEKHDKALVKTKQPKHTIEVIKPIVSGATSGSNKINLVLDKFSQMPIYYSMVKGTNLEKLYVKMMNANVGYAIMVSGRKVGAEALHDLYLKDGSFNEAAFNNNIEVSWKSYGIQVETTYEGEKEQTRGSQLTKLSTLDLYNNGEALSEDIAKEVKRNKDILDRLHKNGYERFLKRLGIEDLGGSYRIADKKALAKTLQDEMFRRELSDNVKDSIQLDEQGEFIIPFEASPAYLQIKSILYSFIDKNITSPKMNGGSYVQAPVTLWENAKEGRKIAIKTEDGYKRITRQEYETYSDEQKKNVVLTDDTLKFYEDEDGKRYCEVLLPHWFKGKLGKHASKTDEELIKFLNTTAEGRELLSGIGFRIPTQSLSSVEAFKVKGFLPQYMGKTVVVPSEITTKSGSDFDIDKLNMYLKAVYVDKNGEIVIARLKGTEEATREFYGKVFDDKLKGQKASKAELLEAVDIFTYQLDDPKKLVDRYIETIEALMEDVQDASDASEAIMERLKELGNVDVQNALKQKFMDEMYRRALENEYYDSLEKLVTLPENFQRLISPVGDDGLKALSDELDVLRGYDENKIKNRMLNRNFLTNLRHAFVTAKKWVGIAAVNITGHSLTQKFKAYIDPERFNNVSLQDAKILRHENGEVLLDHNKLEKDGKNYISLSGRLDAAGEFISDGLSGFATSFVDVAKDPYILKIIKSDLAVGTFMFLRRIGVPKRQIAMFMNQPIIDEYLTLLDNNGVKGLFDTRRIEEIQKKFPTTVNQKERGFNKAELEDNIKNYYATKDLGAVKNHEQQNIFKEFLKYAKMAEYNFKLTQASNYDTTKFQSGDSLSLKQWRTEAAKEQNIISSVGDLLENSFIGVQADYLDRSMEAMGSIFTLEQDAFVAVTDRVLKSFSQDMFLSKDKFDRIANKIKAAFLDYIVQRRSDIATDLKGQLVDNKTSVAQMLTQAKKDFPGVQLIDELQVDSSGRIGGAETIKLRVNDKIAYTENMYQGMMRELRDDPRTNALYNGIVRLAILQGTYQSPISIKNIIPVEDYAKHISPIFSGLKVDAEIEGFATSYEFQRNEWQDNDVVPIVEPRFQEVEDLNAPPDAPRRFQAGLVKVGNGEDAVFVPGAFPTIEGLKIQSKERQLLFLNVKYNAKVTNYDVIKVPMTIPINKKKPEEGKLDVKTGKEITNQTYAEKYKKGDTSLRNYYGYQKVKYADGSPVVASYDKDGNPTYIYKLINLHGDGQYATEYYGDGRPSVFNNGSQKNVKNVEGTIVSNEIPDQTIIDFYGGETVPQDVADPIIATIERESENLASLQPVSGKKANIAMQPFNIEKIKSGEKTTTTRSDREFEKIGIPVGQSSTVNFGGQDFTVINRGLLSIEEAGGKEAMLKSEGYATVDDLLYQQTKDWMSGKGKLYVYDIQPTQSSTSVTPKGTINVYWGQPESATSTRILSNLAPRKFSYESTDGVTREYGSVEHAYQSNKNGKFDNATYNRANDFIGNKKNAPKLTEVGKRGNLQIMKDLVVTSFEQNRNSEAAKKLLQYENFTHNTNEIIDKAFLEGLKLAQQSLLSSQPTQPSTNIDSKTNFQLKQIAEEENLEGIVLGENEIIYNDVVIGKVFLPVGFKNYTIKGIMLNEEFLNKGLGKAFYKWLGYKATSEGATLNSDFDNTSESAKRVWESLKKEGLAEDTQMGYRFKTAKPTQPVVTETNDRQIKVNQFNITVKPDGTMFYDNGKEVTDQTTKNKVNVRKELQDGTLRSSVYNNSNYFVLLDDRIVGSGKTNLGKESISDPKIKEAILAKAITYKKTC